MCGRVTVKTTLLGLMASFGAHRAEGDGLDDLSPRFNGSPGQDYPIIVREPDVAGAVFMRARWGLIPRWMKDAERRAKTDQCPLRGRRDQRHVQIRLPLRKGADAD